MLTPDDEDSPGAIVLVIIVALMITAAFYGWPIVAFRVLFNLFR